VFVICGLFNGTVSSSDYVVPDGKIIGEEWLEDVEGHGHFLI